MANVFAQKFNLKTRSDFEKSKSDVSVVEPSPSLRVVPTPETPQVSVKPSVTPNVKLNVGTAQDNRTINPFQKQIDFSMKESQELQPLNLAKKTSTPAKVQPSVLELPTILAKEGAQGAARSYGSAILTAANFLKKTTGEKPVTKIETKDNPVLKAIFGEAGIKPLGERIKQNTSKYGVAAAPLIALSTILDFTGFGGEKNAIKALTRATKSEEVIKILKGMKINDDLIKATAEGFAATKTEAETAKALENLVKVQDLVQSSAKLNVMQSGAKQIDNLTKDEMIKVIDYIRSPKKTFNQKIEEDAAALMEKYGIQSKKLDEKVAQKFQDLVEGTKTRDISGRVPIEQGIRERGFVTSVKESPAIVPEVKKSVSGKYVKITNEETLATAKKLADTDESAALLKISDGKLDADYTATGIALMDKYQSAGDFGKAADVANQVAAKLTEGGQFVQAARMLDRLSPEGWLTYAARRMQKAGQELSPELAKKITDLTTELKAIPEDLPYNRFLKIQEIAGVIAQQVPRSRFEKGKDIFFELWTLPKSIAASGDFSAAMRQGIFPASTFPKQWGQAFKAQFKAAASEKGYASLMNDIMNSRYFQDAVDAGISFSDVNLKMTGREERFMSSWAEKIWGVKSIVRPSNRAYTGFLNKMRMDMFASFMDDAKRIGVKVDDKWLSDTAKFINDATGRGDFVGARGSLNKILNGLMFSPRLMYSRLRLLAAPATYMNAAPQVRQQVIKSWLSFGASTAGVLTLADMIPGVDVGLDPRSADFAKIKIGDTRFDIAGGFQQYIRIASQLATGKYVSTTTGRVVTLGEGYNPISRLDVLTRGAESKLSPFASLIDLIMRGQNAEGEKPNIPIELGKRFVPMFLNDLWEVYKNDPALLPGGFLGMFGVGVQSYPMSKPIVKMKEIQAMPEEQRVEAFKKLEKEDPIMAGKVKDAWVQSTFNEFDWSLTYMKVDDGERAKFLVEHLNRLEPT